MGDRANVIFRTEDGDVVLYTHWAGHEIGEMLREGLAFGSGRWLDPSYCTRICVTRMTADAKDEETGWGLSTCPQDNEHNMLVVDYAKQEVRVLSSDDYHADYEKWKANPKWLGTPVSFSDFIKRTDGNIHLRRTLSTSA